MRPATLRKNPTEETLFNLVETETLALVEYLSSAFLETFDVFAPFLPGRTRDHGTSKMSRGFLHHYYMHIYGIRIVERGLNNTVVWFSCGFGPPSRDAADRFLTDLGLVVDHVLRRVVEQAADSSLLEFTFRTDSTTLVALAWNDDASWNYDSV